MCISKRRSFRLALWFATWSLFSIPGLAWSVGLGEIEVSSALNEKFSGTIELLDADGLQESEVVVSMASREDFERVGVERFFYLTDISFDVDFSNGTQVVLSSSQAISEPYLNFIVEILWPRGRLLKEYTVLLDPPTFSTTQTPAVAPPRRVAAEPVAAAPSRAQPTRVNIPANQPVASGTPSRMSQDVPGTVMSTREDTLWKIASRTLPSGRVNVNQQMLAIQRLNPEAFMRNNINLLKAGYRLDIPTEDQALGVSGSEAQQEVAQQTEQWRNHAANAVASNNTSNTNTGVPERAAQVDATSAGQTAVESSGDLRGQVRIVANGGESVQGSDAPTSESAGPLLEANESLQREVDELTYQLDREKELASNEVALKDRQLEVKNQELAQLQERLGRLEEEMQAVKKQNQSTPNTTQQPAEWWMSPTVLGGLIGVLVLILAALLVVMRRNSAATADVDDFEDDEDWQETYAEAPVSSQKPHIGAVAAIDEVEQSTDEDAGLEEALALDDEISDFDELDSLASGADEGEDLTEDAATGAQQDDQITGDVIGEADIYVAYGRFGQALSLLDGSLAKEPDQHEVRLKMLEVCVEANEVVQFEEHARYLVDHCEDQDVLLAVRELEARMEESADLEVDLGGGVAVDVPGDAEPEPITEPQSADAGFASDDLLDEDVEEVSAVGDLDLQDDVSLDLELDDDSALENTDDEFQLEFDDESDAANADAGSLGGDLGIDFDPEHDGGDESAATVAAADASDSEAEFDLSDEDFTLGDADELEPQVSEPTAAVDLEEPTAEGSAASPAASNGAALDDFDDDDFDFGDSGDADINATKLDLAEAYIDMGDGDGATDILKEVAEEGSPEQQARANELLAKI